mgnify:CR=1 FL=1
MGPRPGEVLDREWCFARDLRWIMKDEFACPLRCQAVGLVPTVWARGNQLGSRRAIQNRTMWE